jgi:hypothetical protein
LNEALTTEDPTQIKDAIERLKNSSMEIGKAIYSNQDGAEGEGATEEPKSEEPKPEEPTEEKKEDEKKEEPKDEKK